MIGVFINSHVLPRKIAGYLLLLSLLVCMYVCMCV